MKTNRKFLKNTLAAGVTAAGLMSVSAQPHR